MTWLHSTATFTSILYLASEINDEELQRITTCMLIICVNSGVGKVWIFTRVSFCLNSWTTSFYLMQILSFDLKCSYLIKKVLRRKDKKSNFKRRRRIVRGLFNWNRKLKRRSLSLSLSAWYFPNAWDCEISKSSCIWIYFTKILNLEQKCTSSTSLDHKED